MKRFSLARGALIVAAMTLGSLGWAQNRSWKPRSLIIGPPHGQCGAEKLAWASDSRFLAVAQEGCGSGSPVQIWNARSGVRQRELGDDVSPPFASVRSLAFSPDGETLAADRNAIGYGHGIRVWRWRSGKALGPLDPTFGPFAWVSNDQLVSHTYLNLRFRMWDVSNARA